MRKMRIALCQVDGKWPNLALAKLAAAHKADGDDVEWFTPLAQYDIVWAAKVFTDTPDDPYLPISAARGGTGYPTLADTRLVGAVEATRPDFSLWPSWRKSMGFSTRGCVRTCPFCVVPAKEGALKVVAEFGDLWDGRSSELVLLDNNLTAAPIEHLRRLADDARAAGVRLDPCQGLDARLLTDEHAAIIAGGPFVRWLHIAFDSVRQEASVRRAVALLKDAGVEPRSRLMCYVLIGFDSTPEDDLYRVELLRTLDLSPFVMPFNRRDPYQRRFARWANRPKLFRSCAWKEYAT
jgi:hypothetical protein